MTGGWFLKAPIWIKLLAPGSLARGEEPIPNSISDATSFTSQMGQRYLWVDSFCILQDDEKELEIFVHGMTEIYSTAYFTIVSATGSDPYSGLPGVYPTARPVSLVSNVGLGLIARRALGLSRALAESYYSTRAWTLQEEVLSQRIIAFAIGVVYFSSKKGERAEEHHHWTTSTSVLARLRRQSQINSTDNPNIQQAKIDF